jgi:uncharacterized protein YrrD
LQKGREITGLPVVSLASGKEIGSVDDILWSHPDLKIRYLVVGEHYLPFPGISAIGTDAVTISGPEVLEEQAEEQTGEPDEEQGLALKSISQTGGEVVLTEDGENLGILKDVLFDAVEGEIKGYELSTGVVGDLLSGRMNLSPEMVLSWGKESIIARYNDSDRGGQDAVPDMQG